MRIRNFVFLLTAALVALHAMAAEPDGHTVLLTTYTTHAANPAMFKKLPYDPVKDFGIIHQAKQSR